MNATQTKLIREAATQEVDGEGWRKRMDAWLDAKPQREFYGDIAEILRSMPEIHRFCLPCVIRGGEIVHGP